MKFLITRTAGAGNPAAECTLGPSAWETWFKPHAVKQFESARAAAIHGGNVKSADPRVPDILAYPLGKHQSPQLVEGMPVWFEAWAQPDVGRIFYKDQFHQWFEGPMLAGHPPHKTVSVS